MSIKVLHDRVLLRKLEPEATSASGIFLTNAVEPTYEAVVLEVGEGTKLKDGTICPLEITVGDKVIYNPKAGATVKIDGEELLVTKAEDIFCVVEE